MLVWDESQDNQAVPPSRGESKLHDDTLERGNDAIAAIIEAETVKGFDLKPTQPLPALSSPTARSHRPAVQVTYIATTPPRHLSRARILGAPSRALWLRLTVAKARGTRRA
jgi:hypothetical protein